MKRRGMIVSQQGLKQPPERWVRGLADTTLQLFRDDGKEE